VVYFKVDQIAPSPSNVVPKDSQISGDSSHLYGDGMAMWISTTRAEPGPIYGSVDLFNGLGIIIDTYANSAHNYGMPRVLAAVGDGHKKFDLEHDGEGSSLGACSVSGLGVC
jgi:mannose-binding lectin 2